MTEDKKLTKIQTVFAFISNIPWLKTFIPGLLAVVFLLLYLEVKDDRDFLKAKVDKYENSALITDTLIINRKMERDSLLQNIEKSKIRLDSIINKVKREGNDTLSFQDALDLMKGIK